MAAFRATSTRRIERTCVRERGRKGTRRVVAEACSSRGLMGTAAERHRLPGFPAYKRRILSPHIERKSLIPAEESWLRSSPRRVRERERERERDADGSLPNRGSGLSRRLLGQPTPASPRRPHFPLPPPRLLRSSGCLVEGPRAPATLPPPRRCCPFQMTGPAGQRPKKKCRTGEIQTDRIDVRIKVRRGWNKPRRRVCERADVCFWTSNGR